LRVFENNVVKGICGPKREEITGGCRKLHDERFIIFTLHQILFTLVGFEVLRAVSLKMAVFWVVVLYRLVEVYQCFRGPCCLNHQGNEFINSRMMRWAGHIVHTWGR
jgi:hypothetical protein